MIYNKLIAFGVVLLLGSITPLLAQDYTLEIALEGTSAPVEVQDRMCLVKVRHLNVEGKDCEGYIVVNSSLVEDVERIFEYAIEIKYPIEMVKPIKFDMPNNGTSMAHLNNTYGFHYRPTVTNPKVLSNHSLGQSIDFNPFQNPYIGKKGEVLPKGATYDKNDPRTLTKNHPFVLFVKSLGWTWGGDWTTIKDYMHFEKKDKKYDTN